MSGTLVAALAVMAAGFGVVMWIAIGRVMQRVDQLPPNTPVAFVQNRSLETQSEDRKVVVCVGDSITHGSISSNYVDMLSSQCDAGTFTFVNAGVNSDLAYNVLQRLDEVVECEPDIVTVLIGTNDVNALTNRANLNRYMKEQHLPQIPDQTWYRENLAAIVRRLRDQTDARIALLSIPPVGEDPTHPAYRRSEVYGELIQAVAADAGVDYLPLREVMVEYLKENRRTGAGRVKHTIGNVAVAIFRRFSLNQSYSKISAANGQAVLTDHLHLNEVGAGLVADLISNYLQQI